MFRKNYFNKNAFLSDIWLSDNPWRCECDDPDMKEFFQYLMEPPFRVIFENSKSTLNNNIFNKTKSQIKDYTQLRCTSPDKFHGKRWEKACIDVWFPSSNRSAAEKVRSAMVIVLLVLAIVSCVVYGFKKWSHKKKMERELEEQMNAEAQREL